MVLPSPVLPKGTQIEMGSRVLGLDSLMPFGRYQGHQIEDMIEDHPSYIEWLVQDEIVEFDEETLELIAKKGIA